MNTDGQNISSYGIEIVAPELFGRVNKEKVKMWKGASITVTLIGDLIYISNRHEDSTTGTQFSDVLLQRLLF